jgi:hypothetical protein
MATIEKKYVYKVTRGSTYLGVLPNVVSEFSYTHNINSAGTQMEIEVADTADTSNLSVEDLQDEYGNPLQAEDGSTLTTERVADLVGDDNSKALIRNDNKIEVIEFSETYPNGSTVFRGFISKYKVTFGGVDSVSITVLSNGQDLNHYLVPGSTTDTLDQSQTEVDGTSPPEAYGIGTWAVGSGSRIYGQEWKVGSGVTNLSVIKLQLQTYVDQDVLVKVWSSAASAIGGTPLGTMTTYVSGTAWTEYTFRMATPITVTPLTTYFFTVEPTAGTVFNNPTLGINVFGFSDNIDKYPNGRLYRSLNGAAYDLQSIYFDMYFKTYSLGPSTAKTYTTSDPSTGILQNVMDYYTASGGALTLSTPSATGYSVTYTFNINTTLEGINKAAEFGPSNWYWYTNPATDTMYYKATGTTADHTMIKGRHINELAIEATKEQIANVVYFTGGEVSAGVNAYVNVNDTASLASNRRGLVRLNDPKAKGASGNATGTIIANNYISGHNAQTYITRIEVIDGTYDITQFDLGEIVGFGSFGTFVDRLLLQIVGIQRKVDSVVLDLGVLPHRATEQMEQVRQSLEATQTVNNPSSPS